MKLRLALAVIVLLTLSTGFSYATLHTVVKGLAELDIAHGPADRLVLGVTEYYHWGSCGGAFVGCTNMNRNWMLPQTTCPSNGLLLGNEPTNAEPAGHPISASVAASVTVAIETACPGMLLVVANIHVNNYGAGKVQEALTWLTDYYAAYTVRTGHPFLGIVGLHCYYSPAVGACEQRLTAAMQLAGFSGHFWITETQVAQVGGAWQTTWRNLLNWYSAQARIDRVYAWTNRQSPYLDMVNSNGTLNADGVIFRDWQAQSYSVSLPSVGASH